MNPQMDWIVAHAEVLIRAWLVIAAVLFVLLSAMTVREYRLSRKTKLR